MSDENKKYPDPDQDIEDIISAAMKAKKNRLIGGNTSDKEEPSEPAPVREADEDMTDFGFFERGDKHEDEDVPKAVIPDEPEAEEGPYDETPPARERYYDDEDDEDEYVPPRPVKKKSTNSKKNSSSKKKKKKKWTKKEKTYFTIGILFLLLCLLGLAAYLIFHYYYSLLPDKWDDSVTSEAPVVSADDSTASDTFDPRTEEEKLKDQLKDIEIDLMKDSDVLNILLVGEDLRSTTTTESRGNTDVMMMISINHKLETITMTSFMRDLWLYIPQINISDRLNRAYYAGGPEYLRFTLQEYFGVSIDKYVVVNFNQFIDIVDALGGLDLYVTPDEANGYEGEDPDGDNTRGMQNPLDEQNAILGNPWGTDYIEMSYDIDGETLHLNGNQALAYSRIRHVGNVDFDRTRRQRIVIGEIIKKAKGASLVQLNDIAHKVFPTVYNDFEEGEIASLLLNILSYLDYEVQEFRIPEDYTFTGHYIDGKSVLLCNTVKNAMDLQELIYGTTNVTEEQLKKYAEQNVYYDDNGNYIDYNNGIVNY